MIDAILAAIAGLLTTDPTLVAALRTLNLGSLGSDAVPQTIVRGNRPMQSLGQEKYPCWIVELDDLEIESLAQGSASFLAMNGSYQGVARNIRLALVWHQPDPDTAFGQRKGLEEPLVQLFLRQLDLGITGVTAAYVSRIEPDRGANHPTQIWRATVRVEYAIPRA